MTSAPSSRKRRRPPFPQTDIGNDPHGIRDYAQAIEALGYTHTLVFDHEALGEDLHVRGKRIAEQIEVLRALWTRDVVTFAGASHRITEAGINPLPVQRPIPLWMGGHSEVVMQRAARLADGWIWSGNIRPDATAHTTVDKVHWLVKAAGRDPAAFGIEGRITVARLEPDRWAGEIAAWRSLPGITHLSVDTMRMGLTKPDQHIEMLRRFKEAARV